jgi:hypothetical protein
MLIDWLLLEGFSFSLTVVAQLLRNASSPRAARGERKRDFMECRSSKAKPGVPAAARIRERPNNSCADINACKLVPGGTPIARGGEARLSLRQNEKSRPPVPLFTISF